MLKLNLPKDPYWIDLGMDVRVKVRPCTSAVFYHARAQMNQRLQKLGDEYRALRDVGATITNLPNLEDPSIRAALAEQYLTLGLAQAGIIEWEGILLADIDEPAEVSADNIDELFSAFWVIAETFRQKYTGMQELLESEKNVLRPAPDGTQEMGQITATPAKSRTDPAQEDKQG